MPEEAVMRKATAIIVAAIGCLSMAAGDVRAAEGGAGVYLLGLRGQGAGVTPPPGVFLSDQTLFYDAQAGGQLTLSNGSVGVSVEATPVVNIATVLWVTPVEILGGNLGFSATLPFGKMEIGATVAPFGSLRDSVFTVGDPSLGMFTGWHSGDFHVQAGVTAFLPIGDYRSGEIANVAKHRLAADVYAALTWFDPETGVDVTSILGVTVNAENAVTDYRTGTEFHWEGSLTRKFGGNFSAGIVGYYYNQLTGDSGSGAALGDFRGEIAAIGATAGLDFIVGHTPVSTKLRYYHEFAATNRLEGDAVFFSASLPLWIDQ